MLLLEGIRNALESVNALSSAKDIDRKSSLSPSTNGSKRLGEGKCVDTVLDGSTDGPSIHYMMLIKDIRSVLTSMNYRSTFSSSTNRCKRSPVNRKRLGEGKRVDTARDGSTTRDDSTDESNHNTVLDGSIDVGTILDGTHDGSTDESNKNTVLDGSIDVGTILDGSTANGNTNDSTNGSNNNDKCVDTVFDGSIDGYSIHHIMLLKGIRSALVSIYSQSPTKDINQESSLSFSTNRCKRSPVNRKRLGEGIRKKNGYNKCYFNLPWSWWYYLKWFYFSFCMTESISSFTCY
jgi:hypothetical protein